MVTLIAPCPLTYLRSYCDELVLEQLGFVQAFKQLSEGSKTLQTDVKFKDALTVDGKPVVVTMNGDNPLKFHPQEFYAINNRNVILQMDEPIRGIFTNRQLDQIRDGALMLPWLILNCKDVDINEGEAGLEEFLVV